jgi:hypothetical protein
VRRRAIVLKHREKTARQICRILDAERVSMPEKWPKELRTDHGLLVDTDTWEKAYTKNIKLRQRIDNIFRKDRKTALRP